MLQHLTLDGDLKIGQYKTISCKVQLEVAVVEDDDWADDIPIDYSQFVDGVRVIGELSFDTSPIEWRDKHPVKKSVTGELVLSDGEETTKINILIVEKSGEVDILPRQIKRYFWQFFAVGKPAWDKLKIFPENYRGRTMNRIYSCTDFRGYWPVGVASIIVATDKKEAKRLLDAKLKEAGIPPEGDGHYTLTEIDIQSKGAVILNDGKYI